MNISRPMRIPNFNSIRSALSLQKPHQRIYPTLYQFTGANCSTLAQRPDPSPDHCMLTASRRCLSPPLPSKLTALTTAVTASRNWMSTPFPGRPLGDVLSAPSGRPLHTLIGPRRLAIPGSSSGGGGTLTGASGSCGDAAADCEETKLNYVRRIVESAKVVVLMKGVPKAPQCGFSNAVCRILEAHGILDAPEAAKPPGDADGNASLPVFNSFDVLSDDALRSDAKVFADWPTFPQVYLQGNFIGGCDVLIEMHRSGDLITTLAGAGLRSRLTDGSD